VSTLQTIAPPQPPDATSSASEPEWIARERHVLDEIRRLVTQRASTEAKLRQEYEQAGAAADASYQKASQTLAERVETLWEDARLKDEQRRRKVVDDALSGEKEAKEKFAKNSRRIAGEFDTVRETAKKEYQRARAEAAAAFETGERQARAQHAAAVSPIDEANEIISAVRERLEVLFEDYRKFGLEEPPTTPSREINRVEDPGASVFDSLHRSEAPLKLLEGLIIPRAMKGRNWIWLFVVLAIGLTPLLVWIADWTIGLSTAGVVTLALGFVSKRTLDSLSRKQVARLYYPLYQTLIDVEEITRRWRARVDEALKAERARVTKKRDEDYQNATEAQRQSIAQGEAQRDQQLRQINDTFAQRMVEVQTKQQMDMREAITAHERRQAELSPLHAAKQKELNDRHGAHKEKLRTEHEAAWTEMSSRWRDGMHRAGEVIDEIARYVNSIGPPWNDPSWAERSFPGSVPPVLRFGELRLNLNRWPGGVSVDAELMKGIPASFVLPALRAFPSRANLVIEAPAEGRAEALRVLQANMLRMLTSLPPAQVRFTIIDPIGIGRNFGAFMHLADFDEALVNGQVWTEPRQIEERLADLAVHMERVTQRYLRNEYATIEEYNAVAEEVAEPYRVLVIADFPAQFDERAVSRLLGIMAGGVPCGVLTLLAVDRERPLPEGLTMDDLRVHALYLSWDQGRLAWDDAEFGKYPLGLDAPPAADVATRLIHRTGAAAKDAKRVEVPFEFIAPPREAWWTRDSRAGIDVPLGKAGATKRQNLTLGEGTSQHVLIAGRTGSGKSTLMHALIANLALNYSPDQVDLYLIDFKKGVEFKIYATHMLPHASVVAIESEREFGISVLQRLDAAMRERAEHFRAAGVQDLNGYRNAPGTPPMPRMLLIIDEFQEFFVEEDKVAQEAALLLDRLVRQGRAFGVHVHLGSQTLGGAFSLARSTLGQMAVRIALQCSEADAHLILAESNPAAKMLTRPGEAVYNDANGLPEGNHFFQVVWLPDERREFYLEQLRELARDRPPVLGRTPIVFEGDAPAELSRNVLLRSLLEAPTWPESPRSAQAWLGDAVAIKDPTSALFRRQGANHLLIVGQNDEAALAMLISSLVSLSVQFAPPSSETARSGARFAVLDGTPEDHPRAGLLPRVAKHLPQPIDIGAYRDVPRILAAVGEEVERRQQPDADGPELFLLIHDLPRFRELRRREDDFGFGRRDEPAAPTDHLRTILREGPVLGVHVITWCDNLNNLNRIFDNQTLREFDMRVLFQMSPTDSAHLLDAPHASRLGPHRAFFASEEQNRLEKFRPYGFPERSWLDRLGERLRARERA
jgi:hypothetical protein